MKEGSEILLGSQHYAYCYTFDLMSDKTYKIPLPHGITNMKVGWNRKFYIKHNFIKHNYIKHN
jgi:hypothetical protein